MAALRRHFQITTAKDENLLEIDELLLFQAHIEVVTWEGKAAC